MKLKFILLLPVLLLLFSCENTDPESSSLELSASKLDAKSDGETLEVALTCSEAWTASSDVQWCTPNVLKGDGNYTLKLTVSANLETLTRQATVTIKSNGASKSIQVSQQGASAPIAEYHYKIPVIFHVLYQDRNASKQYIRKGRLAKILSDVNQIYRDKTKSQDMNLEFILATEDPKTGQTLEEPGVERILWDKEYPIDCELFMKNNTGAYTHLLWEPNQYINIMIYNFKREKGSNSITLGISHIPFTTNSFPLGGLNQVDYKLSLANLRQPYGLSINSLYIEEEKKYDHFNVIVTLAHELGHYLGLLHAFSDTEDEDECKDTDYCNDTPTYNMKEYNNYINHTLVPGSYPLDVLAKKYDCVKATSFISHNIMDYSFSYSDQFTLDQRERIRHVLSYSPLIPGPKIGRNKTRAAPDGLIDLPIRTIK